MSNRRPMTTMTAITPLSTTAQAVCAANWQPRGATCHRCPIHAECTSPVAPLSDATLQAWRDRVNAAAERVLQTEPTQ